MKYEIKMQQQQILSLIKKKIYFKKTWPIQPMPIMTVSGLNRPATKSATKLRLVLNNFEFSIYKTS